MVDINTEGMEIAPLDQSQMDSLLKAEKELNRERRSGEIYLLAVTRKV
ncbi:MAG: hypothetical protein ACOY31_12535 [Bacillota bacterium]